VIQVNIGFTSTDEFVKPDFVNPGHKAKKTKVAYRNVNFDFVDLSSDALKPSYTLAINFGDGVTARPISS
jgi:hypothetical protein